MGSVGFWEIVALVTLALLVFGPERLPGIARTVGRNIAKFRKEANATLGQLKEMADFEEFKSVTAEMKSVRDDLRSAGADAMAGVTGAAGMVAAGLNPAPFDNDAT